MQLALGDGVSHEITVGHAERGHPVEGPSTDKHFGTLAVGRPRMHVVAEEGAPAPDRGFREAALVIIHEALPRRAAEGADTPDRRVAIERHACAVAVLFDPRALRSRARARRR